MPWSKPRKPGGKPGADEIIPRLAYHIYRRTLDPVVEAQVLEGVGIKRKTLKRYSDYTVSSEPDHNSGPRRLDIYYNICLAMGENPGLVLHAAIVAHNYEGMLMLLASELHAHHRYSVTDLTGEEIEASTTLVLAPGGGSRDIIDVDRNFSPAAA